ncbi:MAG TPA: phage tail protein, partial [Burkholderiales bacterium]|nr:phage tail protein [Burkholderiales bacterium]
MSAMIRGAGGGGGGKGGGGGGRTPQEAPDSLRSRAWARVIDVVSEGEIEGLVDGLKSIYLDDTPVINTDGSENFSGVTIATRTGTQAQDYVPGFAAAESEIAVATEVKAATPVVRSVSNTNLSAVRVTVSVPQLTYQDPSTGDISGTSVELAIDLQNAGGGWQEVRRDTISGKTTSRYQRSYRIELPAPGPWDIRVRRITPDSTQSNLQNKTFWDSYTEIIDAKLRYPNTALVALQVDSAQFNRIPRRGYDIRGLRVRVPVNYDPDTRSYSGIWDGTWKIAWTDNPAWCFYDLLTNERYGLGAYIDEVQVDKWALYEIARYCDELVPDGFGGTEPRFTCNLYLQTRQEAFTVLQQMAAIFRGMVWWSQGALTAVADKP